MWLYILFKNLWADFITSYFYIFIKFFINNNSMCYIIWIIDLIVKYLKAYIIFYVVFCVLLLKDYMDFSKYPKLGDFN